mmetsp:Transcript_60003/g.95300  ORF Transcript_60003/g.95300 Transcript_60003/m.95300 type:complete len:225 (+) Transcript_60003:874-1548(+)
MPKCSKISPHFDNQLSSPDSIKNANNFWIVLPILCVRTLDLKYCALNAITISWRTCKDTKGMSRCQTLANRLLCSSCKLHAETDEVEHYPVNQAVMRKTKVVWKCIMTTAQHDSTLSKPTAKHTRTLSSKKRVHRTKVREEWTDRYRALIWTYYHHRHNHHVIRLHLFRRPPPALQCQKRIRIYPNKLMKECVISFVRGVGLQPPNMNKIMRLKTDSCVCVCVM